MRDVYPHYQVIETTERTIPNKHNINDPYLKQDDVGYATPQERKEIWFGLFILVVLLVIFAMYGR